MYTCNENVNKLNNTYICEVTKTTVSIEDAGDITVYGINMYNSNKELANLPGEYCCIEDISDDFEKVKHLCDCLIELNVYPVHLKNIIEDFLS